MPKAVVLLSGGFDSAAAAAQAIDDGYDHPCRLTRASGTSAS